jgi:acetyltransferase-like isoleucine patch superfamily enzyme
MINLFKILFFNLGRILSFLYPKTLSQVIESILAYTYTGVHARFFNSWGSYSSMAWGCRVTNPQYISVGNNNVFLRNTAITVTPVQPDHSPSVTIGNNCHFGIRNHLTCINRIVIGDNLLTGAYVLISDNSHGTIEREILDTAPFDRPLVSKGGVYIGNNVWIGDKVSILPNVHIGNNVIIGANSVVTNDIPDNCVTAGIPAKIIKQL